jgi:NAD(P)-dependent dehydrogenase (short-subunit alcohol dehydrogenase family)
MSGLGDAIARLFARGMALDLAPRGVRVNAVCPAPAKRR